MEFDFTQLQPFWNWFPRASIIYLALLVLLTLAVVFVGWMLSFIRHGPRQAFSWLTTLGREGPIAALERIGRALWWCLGDLAMISPRRVAALTGLAVKESIRRRVVVAVAVFILVLLFAGWFLHPNSPHPAQLYISFVMTATSYLVLLLTLILCSLSIPTDLKNRTLHTIVTKPVRPSEVILGRVFGFIAIGTALLAIMGTVSYFFVVRGLAHSHELMLAEDSDGKQLPPAKTSSARYHFHRVLSDSDSRGELWLEDKQSHTHSLGVERDDDSGKITAAKIGPAEGELIARVPIFGELSFFDRAGKRTNKGISVGKEWTYRSYIEGDSKQAALWKFRDITEDRFPEGLPVALRISVFRSWKGEIEEGIPGSLSVRIPGPGSEEKWIEAVVFTAKDASIDVQTIPRVLQRGDKKYDLFKDLVKDGEVEIQLRCLAPAQYYGVAQADVYLRTPDAPFFLNFFKGYLGIWLQMCVLTALGVFFSTFLSGPVAILSTAGLLVAGLWHDFLFRLATGQTYGGGPFESLVRLFTQDNVISEMEPGLRATVVQSLDSVFLVVLKALAAILPDFEKLSFADYVANGFNIPGELFVKCLCTAAAFIVPVFVASYFCFKMREVAK
ncbi:MAG: hypothetical protein IT426_17685 [Pirellulales bacterium]|nr:hypothetical protein [Pirellulales bacterium]